MTLARITRGWVGVTLQTSFSLCFFMFDFSSCCCELMASTLFCYGRSFLCVRAGREPYSCVLQGPSAAQLWGGGTGKNGVLKAKAGSVCPSRELGAQRGARAGEAVLESGHGAGFIKAASGGASWHNPEHSHSLEHSHQHPGQQGDSPGTELGWGGPKIISTLGECCPMQGQHRALCWCLLLVRTSSWTRTNP